MTDTTGAQPNAAATPGASPANGAEPNTLDSLIAEFDRGKDAPVVKLLQGIKPLVEHVERQQIKETAEVFTKDFDSAAAELKTVPGAETQTPRQLKGFMREYGAEFPEVEQAWNNRQQAPEAWKTALAKVKTALAEDLKANPASTLKADTLAARAAVANSSQMPAPPVTFDREKAWNMSDREWNSYMREVGQAQGKK